MTDVADLAAFSGVDLFGAFDEAAGHNLGIDPYPAFTELRAEGPFLQVDLHDVLGLDRSYPVTSHAGGYRDYDGPVFSAFGFDAVDAVLRDAHSFDQELVRRSYEFTFGRAMLTMDAPEHRRNRNLVEHAFTRRAMADWATEVVEPLAQERLGALAGKEDVDLVTDFIFFYPAEVIARLLGFPDDEAPEFLRIGLALGNPLDPELGKTAARVLTDWIFATLDQRRAAPLGGGDVLSRLVAAEVDGERLTDEEIAAFVRLLFLAGFETTYRSTGSMVSTLLSTGQWDLLRADRALVPQAIDESLRWQSPILGHPRYAIRDVEMFGVEVPRGSVVHAFFASANRDETRWERAAEFDILRPQIAHASFGFGAHMCIGKHLARLEMATVVNTLLDLYPDIRLAPDATEEQLRVRGVWLRSPHHIPVVLG